MSASTQRQRGISDHAMVEIYERFHQQAKRLGDTDQDAARAALIIVYRFGGMTAEQATQAAYEAVSKLPRVSAGCNAPPSR